MNMPPFDKKWMCPLHAENTLVSSHLRYGIEGLILLAAPKTQDTQAERPANRHQQARSGQQRQY